MVLTIIFTADIDNPSCFAKETQVPRGTAKVGWVMWLPHTAQSKGEQKEHLKLKTFDFCPQ